MTNLSDHGKLQSIEPTLEAMSLMKITAYYRCSTQRQGRSGLGLEAQRDAVRSFAKDGHEVIAEFFEVETGKNNNRPQLAAAIHRAKVTGSVLVIAKLDRLSRNAAFLLALRESGVRFIAADIPNANDMTVGIMSIVAEEERKAIAARTHAALLAAKARGVSLGNKKNLIAGLGQPAAVRRSVEIADQSARDIFVVIADIRESGRTGFKEIAQELMRRQIRTPRGHARWQSTQVRRIVERASKHRVNKLG